MNHLYVTLVCAVTLSIFCTPSLAQEGPHVVTWTTPSDGPAGSMPLGNGDIGVNAWVEADGGLVFYVSKTDAWSGNARLLKVGRVRVTLSPNPFAAGQPFEQTLDTQKGMMTVTAGSPGTAVTVRLWVDANYPAVRVAAESPRAVEMRVALEPWRTEPRELEGEERVSAYGLANSPDPVVVEPDTVVEGQAQRIVWYHRNGQSIWPDTLRMQGMGDWVAKGHDPLLNRTFGGLIQGQGLASENAQALRSPKPATSHAFAVHVLTEQTDQPADWVAQITKVAEADVVPADEALANHIAWWDTFWHRSWIRVSGGASAPFMATNDLPLRIGADSEGGNRFKGAIERVQVFDVALSPEAVARLAGEDAPAKKSVGDWMLSAAAVEDGAITPVAGIGPAARIVDGLAVNDAAEFDGTGWIEMDNCSELDLVRACTLAAWIVPDKLPSSGGRIIDKSKAGKSNGYLLDTYPGNSLRFICEAGTLTHDAQLTPGERVHVAVTFDAQGGEMCLYVNGNQVARESRGFSVDAVNRGYALQRYITACAGRGGSPIKFNGSIFTVDAKVKDESFDADYRRWGGPYWFQNTRLAYWPMLASGDFEMMGPLFRMYADALPFASDRARVYLDAEGAFFPETMYFWGSYAQDNYGWDRGDLPVGVTENRYIRYYYDGVLELLSLMLDYHAYTEDADFVRDSVLPLADAALSFYFSFYDLDAAGRLRMHPAQSLETWQDVVNPLPPVAGIRYVTSRLLALPEDLTSAEQRNTWARMQRQLPELPTGEVDGERVLTAAAEVLEGARNSENPELYAVFPYRLFGVGMPGLEMARRTFEHRRVKDHHGWRQDEIQAARLGLSAEASDRLLRRFSQKDPGSRFPAFWGPNFDWIPDQDHGTSGMMALQTMLLHSDERRIVLFPAWPVDWNVEFKLHAAYNTTVQGVYRDGVVEELVVTPAEREADVLILMPQ